MDTTLILPLLTAFGLGSVFTALVQSWLASKHERAKRLFDERKEAYVGLLEAYHLAAVEPSDKNSKHFAYWQMRCDLVGSKALSEAIRKIIDTNENQDLRFTAHEELKEAMREDLLR
ncbi:MAG: hypothetical protein AAFN43_06490 [Pseudomonadota bacterium]